MAERHGGKSWQRLKMDNGCYLIEIIEGLSQMN